MSAKASLITLQDQKDNNLLVGSNLYLSNKFYDGNSFEKTFSMYDWNWKMDYYDPSILVDNMITSQLYDIITNQQKPLNETPFYVHSQEFNLATDLMTRWDAKNEAVVYDIYNGYSKGVYSDDVVYAVDRSMTRVGSDNTIHHTLKGYNKTEVLLHMHANMLFNENVFFTAKSVYYNLSSTVFELRNGVSTTYDETQSSYTSTKFMVSVNENIISMNNNDTTRVEHVKSFNFRKGWNKVDIIVLLNLSVPPDVTGNANPNADVNIQLLNRKFFSLGWNPTIKNFNPNILIDGTTPLENNAPLASADATINVTIYFNNTHVNDSISKRYISYLSCTYPNLTSFPTNNIQIDNISHHTSYTIKQSTVTTTDASDAIILTLNLKETLNSKDTTDDSFLFHGLNNQLPNTTTGIDFNIIDTLTNTSIKATDKYSFDLNVVELQNKTSTTVVPSLDIVNDYSSSSLTKILYDGSVGIGTSNTQNYALYVNNITNSKKGIYCTDDITILSDGRYKTDVKTIDSPLEKIRRLRGVNYKRTDRYNDKTHMGLIAQE
eukprot:762836-Hanusia_phi.AAC.10